MKKFQRGYSAVSGLWVFVIVLWLLAIGGWIANLVKFVGMNFDVFTPMLVLRGIGIIAAPLGVILGFI